MGSLERRERPRRTLAVRVLALAGIVAVMLVSAVAARATPRTTVSFFLTQHDNFDTIAWRAYGAIEDAGTWAKGRITFSGGKSPVFAGMIETVETNAAQTGTFRMNFQGLGYNATGAFSGTWEISHGTGIYEGIHGTGTWYEHDIPDQGSPGHLLFTFPCAGSVHFD